MTSLDLLAVALSLLAANIGLWTLYHWLSDDPPKE